MKGQCKRILYSYSFPKGKRFQVKHIIQNKGFTNGKFVTFCGLYHRVGENMPCTQTEDMSWSPMAPYENYTQYKDISNFTTNTPWASNTEYDAQK